MSTGYFLHNLVLALCGVLDVAADSRWFPKEGKQTFRKAVAFLMPAVAPGRSGGGKAAKTVGSSAAGAGEGDWTAVSQDLKGQSPALSLPGWIGPPTMQGQMAPIYWRQVIYAWAEGMNAQP